MKDIWFDEDDSCLACGDILTRASMVQGLCSDCVATEGRDENPDLFTEWANDGYEGAWRENYVEDFPPTG
jgi:hypothetical protein